MLAISAIPHHHHHKSIITCFNTEQAEHECDHSHSPKNSSENSNCFLHSNFILQPSDNVIRIKSLSLLNNYYSGFYSDLILSIIADLCVPISDYESEFIEHFYTLLSSENSNPLGLRAPPFKLT